MAHFQGFHACYGSSVSGGALPSRVARVLLAKSREGALETLAAVSLIALHGLAESSAEVDRFAKHLMEAFLARGVRWVFPKAAARPVTLYGGKRALAWFDVFACNRSRVDESGLEAAVESVASVIAEERRRGVPSTRIVLAGFSQGGTLALQAGLQQAGHIGGIIAISAVLPFLERIPAARGAPTPVFVGHGYFDRVVPFSLGRESRTTLRARGYDVEWHGYPVGHRLTPRMLGDIAGWLESRVLAPRVPGASRRSWSWLPVRLLGQS
jgi:phospholipase/carboxylesterase